MNIMIDYDATYTADISLWRMVIPMFLDHGHKVYLVTSRGRDTPVELVNDFTPLNIPIIYCTYRAKKKVCEAQGIKIDIWIDDDPYYIVHGFIEDAEDIQNGPGDSNTVWHLAGGKA
jgi:hypothetical protein